jgi:hypothetical protein
VTINPLWSRLIEQIQDKRDISYTDAKTMAKNILIKRGHLYDDGNLTYDGVLRSNMSPEERAVNRSIKKFGGNENDYRYDSEKNYAYKKNRWNKKR